MARPPGMTAADGARISEQAARAAEAAAAAVAEVRAKAGSAGEREAARPCKTVECAKARAAARASKTLGRKTQNLKADTKCKDWACAKRRREERSRLLRRSAKSAGTQVPAPKLPPCMTPACARERRARKAGRPVPTPAPCMTPACAKKRLEARWKAHDAQFAHFDAAEQETTPEAAAAQPTPLALAAAAAALSTDQRHVRPVCQPPTPANACVCPDAPPPTRARRLGIDRALPDCTPSPACGREELAFHMEGKW